MKQFKHFAFLLFVLCLPLFSIAEQERGFDYHKIEEYKQQAEFDYSQEYSKTESFIAVLLSYIFSKMANLFGHFGSSVSPVIFQLLILLAVIIVVIFLAKLKYGHILTSKAREFQSLPVQYSEGEKINYQTLLEESIANKQFKLAVRYIFINCLLLLEKQKLIKTAQWKAPYDYLYELPEGKREGFKQLVDLFELTWYGNYSPDEQVVNKGLQVFHHLKNA